MTAHRKAWRMTLRPGAEADYDREHARIWPEMLAEMRKGGVLRFLIYRDGCDVFAWQERDGPFPEPGALPSETLRNWWRAMEPLMLTDANGQPRRRPMTEVFVLEEGTGAA